MPSSRASVVRVWKAHYTAMESSQVWSTPEVVQEMRSPFAGSLHCRKWHYCRRDRSSGFGSGRNLYKIWLFRLQIRSQREQRTVWSKWWLCKMSRWNPISYKMFLVLLWNGSSYSSTLIYIFLTLSLIFKSSSCSSSSSSSLLPLLSYFSSLSVIKFLSVVAL